MPFALLIDEVVFTGQRGNTLLTRLLMTAVHAQGLQIMAKFFITNEPLAVLTLLVVRMIAYLWMRE